MVLKKGDFVRVNFQGKIKETGEVFDTTYENIAKEHGLYDPKLIFRARPLVVGAGHILPGIDKNLVGAEVGEKKLIQLSPEEGFGKRDPSKIKTVPLREFKKQNINPIPGMRIEFEDSVGRVQSVGGGRVRIDLNHGLAGKVLEYEVKVEEKTNKKEERIRQLLELYIPNVDPQEFIIGLKEGITEIILPDKVRADPSITIAKISVVRDSFKYIEGVDQVAFKEVYKKPVPTAKEDKTAKAEKKPKKQKTQKKPRKKTSKSS